MAEPMERPTRVLCVDDETGLADLVARMLEDRGDRVEATGMSDPTAVVSQLEAEEYDCVISDYEMPKLDGLELLDAVRDAFPGKPFILYTGKGSEAIASEAISKGVTDYLQKDTGTEQYDLLANRCLNAVEQVRNRQRRERAEQWYHQLFDQRLVGVGLSQDGTYRQANEFFAELLGYEPHEMVGMDVLSTVKPADRQRVRRAIEQRERGNVDKVRYSVDIRRKDGSIRPVKVVGSRVRYEGDPAVLGLIQPAGTGHRTPPGPLTERLSMAIDALPAVEAGAPDGVAEAIDHLQRAQALLSDPVSTDAESDECTALGAAAERAADLANVGTEAKLVVDESAEIDACKEVVVRLIEQILVGTIGGDPGGATVTVSPTEGGFEVRIRAPDLANRLDMPLVSSFQSPPNPITDSQWSRGVDVYSTLGGSETVVYEVVFPAMIPEPS